MLASMYHQIIRCSTELNFLYSIRHWLIWCLLIDSTGWISPPQNHTVPNYMFHAYPSTDSVWSSWCHHDWCLLFLAFLVTDWFSGCLSQHRIDKYSTQRAPLLPLPHRLIWFLAIIEWIGGMRWCFFLLSFLSFFMGLHLNFFAIICHSFG